MAGNLLHLVSCQSGAPQEASEGECGEKAACVPLFLFPGWAGVCVCVWWGCWLGGARISLVVRRSLSSPKLLRAANFEVPEPSCPSTLYDPSPPPPKGLFQIVSQFGRETGRGWGEHRDRDTFPVHPSSPVSSSRKPFFYKSTPAAQGRCPKCK